jgi:hypothetical protein
MSCYFQNISCAILLSTLTFFKSTNAQDIELFEYDLIAPTYLENRTNTFQGTCCERSNLFESPYFDTASLRTKSSDDILEVTLTHTPLDFYELNHYQGQLNVIFVKPVKLDSNNRLIQTCDLNERWKLFQSAIPSPYYPGNFDAYLLWNGPAEPNHPNFHGIRSLRKYLIEHFSEKHISAAVTYSHTPMSSLLSSQWGLQTTNTITKSRDALRISNQFQINSETLCNVDYTNNLITLLTPISQTHFKLYLIQCTPESYANFGNLDSDNRKHTFLFEYNGIINDQI